MTTGCLRVPNVVWLVALLGLLGLPGIVFIPLLLRWVGTEVMANILVMQVYVYYLTLLVQYGFNWSGPASLGKLNDSAARLAVLQNSIATKLFLFAIPVTLIFLFIVFKMWDQAGGYLGLFWIALLGFACNSNWYLQSQGRFQAGVVLAGAGFFLAGPLLVGLFAIRNMELSAAPYLAVLTIIMPQLFLGIGSWLVSTGKSFVPMAVNLRTEWPSIKSLLANGWLLVLSQVFLASNTLGTVVVHQIADVDVTASYAATERVFNLAATFLVGIYTALYPKLSELYYRSRTRYWRNLSLLGAGIFTIGLCATVIVGVFGDKLFVIYLGDKLFLLIAPVLIVFALWLSVCVFQHMASSHLVLIGRYRQTLSLNFFVLGLVIAVGSVCARYEPIYWIYGALVGQVVPVCLLFLMWRADRSAL